MLDGGDVRQRTLCRNPRCKERLPQPTEEERKAFCCRACFEGYFHSRCLKCERQLAKDDQRQHKRFCDNRCKKAFHRELGHYDPFVEGACGVLPGTARTPSKNPEISTSKSAVRGDRACVKSRLFGDPTAWPIDLIGGAGGPRQNRLDPELRRKIITSEIPHLRDLKDDDG